MKTFIDLYNHLKSIGVNDFKDFLNNDAWIGKDKLESCFRLFAFLGLFPEFNNYNICIGNYNKNTININRDLKVFLEQSLKDKGDKSDLTFISIDNNTIIATTCKNLKNYHINDLDIRDIKCIYNDIYKQKYTELIIAIVIKNKKEFKEIIHGAEQSSYDIKELIINNSIIIDYEDIYEAFYKFSFKFQLKSIEELFNYNKKFISLKFHQDITINKTLKIFENCNTVLWGHLPRSGKSYIIAGSILLDNKNNYLIITTAPNETIPQFIELFNSYNEFNDYNVIKLDTTKKIKLTNKNIIIVSKQFLQSKLKLKSIQWLKDIRFDIRFIDETHNGGTTDLAKDILDTYSKLSKTVYITATYTKPANNYNIPEEHQILWNLEDINLCKNITNISNYNKFIEKHGNIIVNYNLNNIITEYNTIPDLHYITWSFTKEIKDYLISSDDNGFSIESVLMLQNNDDITIPKFVDENKVEDLIRNIFGYTYINSEISHFNPKSLLGRIKTIASNPKYSTRWFSISKPLIIMCYLPSGAIDILQEAFKEIIIRKKLLMDFEIVCINSKINTKNPKEIIEDAYIKTKNNNKKGLLVLSGKQCSLGITIKECDIVLLMTNINQYDTIFQMIYRCMSEDDNKKCGFVIDVNIQRTINIIMEYAQKINPNISSRDAFRYILTQNLIHFNIDDWNDRIFGVREISFNNIIETSYKIFTSQSNNSIDKLLENLDFKISLFTKEEQLLVKSLFNITNNKTKINKILFENNDVDVNNGIEKTKTKNKEDDIEKDIIENDIDILNDIIKKLIPLLCLITVSNDNTTTFGDMCRFIDETNELREIIIETIITWWGSKVETQLFDIIINLYNKYFINNEKFNNKVADIKDIFKNNLNNKSELSKAIDKFLIPHENETKQNAEISTPVYLRQEMINKIPVEFWNTPKKIFEPCSGKGGFLIDIVNKFMIGLKDYIIDEEERYKLIVEECLYYSDINKQNIFIAKLLLDPYDKYNLNANIGDTLKLNIKEKWNLEGFDAVIGNPPYQENNDDGRKALNHNLWSDFINYSFKLLYNDGYLLFITPNSWMSPTSKNNEVFYENYIIYLNISECEKWFNIGSKFSYYLIQKTINRKETTIICKYNKKIYESKIMISGLYFLPMLLCDKTISIVNKFYNNDLPKVSFKSSSELHNTTKKNFIRDIKDDIYKYPIRHTTKRDIRYSSIKHTLSDNNKILMNLSGNLKPIYDNGTMGFTQAQMYLLIDNDDYINILNSKLYTSIFNICKWSGFNIEKVFYNIPYIDNEENIYDLLKLTRDEIDFIEKL
jgi:adenine-specific DNA-methyltransferase